MSSERERRKDHYESEILPQQNERHGTILRVIEEKSPKGSQVLRLSRKAKIRLTPPPRLSPTSSRLECFRLHNSLLTSAHKHSRLQKQVEDEVQSIIC
jgi:hypothetical protein